MAKNDSKQNTFTSSPHDHNCFDFLFICFISFLFYLFHFSAESEIQDDCTRGRGATAFLSPVLSARTCHFREQNAVLRRNRPKQVSCTVPLGNKEMLLTLKLVPYSNRWVQNDLVCRFHVAEKYRLSEFSSPKIKTLSAKRRHLLPSRCLCDRQNFSYRWVLSTLSNGTARSRKIDEGRRRLKTTDRELHDPWIIWDHDCWIVYLSNDDKGLRKRFQVFGSLSMWNYCWEFSWKFKSRHTERMAKKIQISLP